LGEFFRGSRENELLEELAWKKGELRGQISQILENDFESISKCSSATDPLELVQVHVNVLHLLFGYDPRSIWKVFPDEKRSVLAWIGGLLTRPETSPLFGEISGHVLEFPQLQQVLFMSYFNNPLSAWEKLRRNSCLAIARFVSHLIQIQPHRDYKIPFKAVHLSLLNAIQLIPHGANSVIPLIRSICKFYMTQNEIKSSKYRSFFGEFRMAIVPLFLIGIDPERDIKLLWAVRCLLVDGGKDKTEFVTTFVQTLFGMMRNDDEGLKQVAWRRFRKWLLRDRAVEKLLRKSEALKAELFELARIGSKNEFVRCQLSLLIDGNAGDAGNVKRMVLKKSAALIEGLKRMGLQATDGGVANDEWQ
jgi:hypothetical protein